jgi:hypothetical protein
VGNLAALDDEGRVQLLGLNNRSFLVPDDAPESLPVGDTFLGRHRSLQTVKIGFNYLFNVGPVSAKY